MSARKITGKNWSRSVQSRVMNIVGTLFMAANQWLQVILITRLLGLYEVGLFSYFLALTGPLVLFARFSLSRLVPTQTKLSYDYAIFKQFRDITNYGFIFMSLAAVIFIDLTVYESLCLFFFVLFKFYENKEEFIYTENISESRISFLALSKIYKSILTIIFFTATIFIFDSLLMAMVSLLVSQVLIYYFYGLKFTFSPRKPVVKLNSGDFKKIFALGIGLSLVEVLSSLVSNVPRYMLEYFHSVETLGIFATIMYFALITNNIVFALNEGFIAGLAREARQNIRSFYRSFFKICGVFLILTAAGEIILILFGNDILVLVYGEEFMGYQREMLLLGVLLFFIVYTKLFEMALNVLNLYTPQVVMQAITFVTTIVLSIAVIIPFGLAGAFIVSISTHLLLLLGQITILMYHRKYKVSI